MSAPRRKAKPRRTAAITPAVSAPSTAAEVARALARPPSGDPPLFLATAAAIGWPVFADVVNRANEARGITHTPQHRDNTEGGAL